MERSSLSLLAVLATLTACTAGPPIAGAPPWSSATGIFDTVPGLLLGSVHRLGAMDGFDVATLCRSYPREAGVWMPTRIVLRTAGMEQVIEFGRSEAAVAEPSLFELRRDVRALLERR